MVLRIFAKPLEIPKTSIFKKSRKPKHTHTPISIRISNTGHSCNNLFILQNNRNPLFVSLILIITVALINLITHFMFINYHYVSFNYVISASYYGSILFPVYYTITFILFFIAVLFLKTKAKYFIYFLFIVYILFSLPIIDLNAIDFYH